jgi:hypothetical protein
VGPRKIYIYNVYLAAKWLKFKSVGAIELQRATAILWIGVAGPVYYQWPDS